VGAAAALGREAATDESVSMSSSDRRRGSRDAAGRFADLPEQEAVSDVWPTNPVYRAWREMADRAESATDDTLTANEVAATAVGHRFDPDAVRELTGLFEAVRYGDEPVTETRRQRAESALESIDEPGFREGPDVNSREALLTVGVATAVVGIAVVYVPVATFVDVPSSVLLLISAVALVAALVRGRAWLTHESGTSGRPSASARVQWASPVTRSM